MILCGKVGLGSLARSAVVAAVVLAPHSALAQQTPAPTGAASEPAGRGFPQPVLDSLRAALGAYEEMRGQLAADHLEEVPAGASRLAGALRPVLDGRARLSKEIPGVIEEAVLAAESMASVDTLDAARVEFGKISRSVLLLAAHDPRLIEGRHVFACPMVKTFGKWIQPGETLENPYMGQAMLACGFPTDSSVPEVSPPEEQKASAPLGGSTESDSAAEPVFKPGIPGVKMEDVRDQKFLWKEIDELQRWERGDRISIAEFRGKAIEKTAHFLGFSGAEADEFAAVASQAVAGVRESFTRMQRSGENPGDLNTSFSSDLRAEVSRVTSFLGDQPRHHLFSPDCKKWLLRLAFGPREDKEAKQASAGAPQAAAP